MGGFKDYLALLTEAEDDVEAHFRRAVYAGKLTTVVNAQHTNNGATGTKKGIELAVKHFARFPHTEARRVRFDHTPVAPKEWNKATSIEGRPHEVLAHMKKAAGIKDAVVESLRLSGGLAAWDKADQLLADLHGQTEEHPLNRAARVTPEGVSLEASKFGRGVHISSIASSTKGAGHASKALRTLTGLADKHGVPLTLIPQPTASGGVGKGLSKDQLEGWYARHGFVKAADGQKMVREPSTTIKLTGFKRNH